MTNFSLFSIVISLLSLVTLQYDFFVSDEFGIETIFWVGLSILLLLNTFRHLIKSHSLNIWLSFVMNGLITGITCFNFFVLGLTLFGYGFSGRHTQIIWFVSTSLNIALFATAIIEMVYTIRKNRQQLL